ncbi:acyl-coenzyme A thioesterase 1-like [Ambystoma mexicanum]|uniref:acyl-coenzyme A thioesterase 1-like n=1 Tax=Ambystoma mexicanum TaxID=8296 RepID=UPI0037E86FEA
MVMLLLLRGRAAAAARFTPRAARFLRRALAPARRAHMASVSLDIAPSPKCLFDDPVRISVRGLSPLQAVTLRASLTDETGVLFRSSAQYTAESSGELDLTRSPSLGGSYTGVEPMGLVWSLLPETPFRRLVKRDVCSPLYLDLEVHDAHGPPGQPLAKATNERAFMGEGVRRIPVREGKLKATLFVPPGPGPFPAVIDLYGTAGGLPEYRASLFANRGFMTLALAYFGFEDLPQGLDALHLDYFGAAVEFLQMQQQANVSGIGVLGISKGADLALSMATFLPGIKAAVSISGCGVNVLTPLHGNGFTLSGLELIFEKIVFTADNAANSLEALGDPADPVNAGCHIPVEKSPAAFLFLSGLDDQFIKSALFCELPIARLRKHGRDVEVHNYDGAGHLLEPPYLPLCRASYHKFMGMSTVWGGQTKKHARAQEDAWFKIQNFLFRHLLDSNAKKPTHLHSLSTL